MTQQPFIPVPGFENPYEKNLSIVKEYFKKPFILAYAILSTLILLISTGLSLFLSMNTNAILTQIIKSIISDMLGANNKQLLDLIEQLGNSNYIYNIIQSIILMIPSVIIIYAFYIMYFKSKNPSSLSSPSSGFTINWVFSIIGLVLISLVSLVLLLLLGVLIFVATTRLSQNNADFVIPVLFFIFFVFLVLMPILLIYTISGVRFYSSLKKSVTTLYLVKKGALIYGIANIVFGILGCAGAALIYFYISSIGSIAIDLPSVSMFPNALQNTLHFSNGVLFLNMVQQIFLGIVVLGYRHHINSYTAADTKSGTTAQNPPYSEA